MRNLLKKFFEIDRLALKEKVSSDNPPPPTRNTEEFHFRAYGRSEPVDFQWGIIPDRDTDGYMLVVMFAYHDDNALNLFLREDGKWVLSAMAFAERPHGMKFLNRILTLVKGFEGASLLELYQTQNIPIEDEVAFRFIAEFMRVAKSTYSPS